MPGTITEYCGFSSSSKAQQRRSPIVHRRNWISSRCDSIGSVSALLDQPGRFPRSTTTQQRGRESASRAARSTTAPDRGRRSDREHLICQRSRAGRVAAVVGQRQQQQPRQDEEEEHGFEGWQVARGRGEWVFEEAGAVLNDVHFVGP